MTTQRHTFLKVLFNRFPVAQGDAALALLPEEEGNAIRAIPVRGNDPLALITLPEDLLAHVHYSWLTSAVTSLPAAFRSPVLGALPKEVRQKLSALLKIPEPESTGMPVFQRQLLRMLGKQMQFEQAVPLSFLPDSPATPLLSLNKQKLITVIDLLAMHDLAEEVRHLVDKKKLQAVYHFLTPQEIQYLRRCLQRKERMVSPKMDIEKFITDKQKFESIVHQRGILRLGRALSGQDPAILWHIAHVLDIGRGSILQKYYSAEPIAQVTPVLLEQLTNVLNFLNTESPS